jgi:hypothetical protein
MIKLGIVIYAKLGTVIYAKFYATSVDLCLCR